jgi:transposase InsO family protein
MARREVQAMLRRYRRVWRRRHPPHILNWRCPGSVWAVDFAEPPSPVDGCFPYLLAVRDLASGQQLLWLPVADESAATAINALRSLFREHGPPLVLKSDNGSAFIATDFGAFLAGQGVAQLRSPPECPEYNGSCEAGIGSMKARTHHQAAGRGRSADWTCDDVEAARLQANETARPWGVIGPTPGEVWERRRLIEAEERTAFLASVEAFHQEQRRERGYAADARLSSADQAALDRVAITRGLLSSSLLGVGRDAGGTP